MPTVTDPLELRIVEALGMAKSDDTYAALLEIVDSHAALMKRLDPLDPAGEKTKEEFKALTESLLTKLADERAKFFDQGDINHCGLIDYWKQMIKARMVYHFIGLASTTDEIATIAPCYKETILIDLIPQWVKALRKLLVNGDRAGADSMAKRCSSAVDSLGAQARYTWDAEEAWCDGKSALLAGDDSEALRFFKEGLKFLDRPDLYHVLLKMQGRVGRLLLSTGRQAQAFEEYRQALIKLEFIRMSAEASNRAEIARLAQPLFYGALEAAYALSLFNECLMLVEMAKARSILDFRGMKEAVSAGLPPFLALTGDLANKAALPGKLTILPQFLLNFLAGETSVERFFSLLPEKSVAIHYYLAGPHLYILVASATGLLTVKQFVLAQGFYQACRDALRSLDTPGLTRKDLLAYLYDVLLEPVEDTIPPETEILYVLPHSNLHFLPFHAFLRPDGKGGREYLISRFDLAYSPSMSLLDILDDSIPPSRKIGPGLSALVMGNPDLGDPTLELPGAEEEARHIARILGAEVLTGKEATIEAFMAKAGEVDAISLSCHAHPNIDRPLEGYLALRGFHLTVERILSLDLKATLVSLSACHSGVERITPGDESTGITQAFFVAGARSVISSLWETPDRAASDLMGRFFLHWIRGGLTRVRALRLAQLEMIYSARTSRQTNGFDSSDPYFWAFPLLIGEIG